MQLKQQNNNNPSFNPPRLPPEERLNRNGDSLVPLHRVPIRFLAFNHFLPSIYSNSDAFHVVILFVIFSILSSLHQLAAAVAVLCGVSSIDLMSALIQARVDAAGAASACARLHALRAQMEAFEVARRLVQY